MDIVLPISHYNRIVSYYVRHFYLFGVDVGSYTYQEFVQCNLIIRLYHTKVNTLQVIFVLICYFTTSYVCGHHFSFQ